MKTNQKSIKIRFFNYEVKIKYMTKVKWEILFFKVFLALLIYAAIISTILFFIQIQKISVPSALFMPEAIFLLAILLIVILFEVLFLVQTKRK